MIFSVLAALGQHSKGCRFDSHRGQAYFSSLPGVDIIIYYYYYLILFNHGSLSEVHLFFKGP
jgi:hypothetical protein